MKRGIKGRNRKGTENVDSKGNKGKDTNIKRKKGKRTEEWKKGK